jgi:isopentenyldiphosphate isomerase
VRLSEGRVAVAELVEVVSALDHKLNSATFEAVNAFLRRCDELSDGISHICQHLAPEFGREEYLVCVDRLGDQVSVPAAVLSQTRALSGTLSMPVSWSRIVTTPDGGEILLLARWLCHLGGFRHRTVHLFLDHPELPDHTLVQVRGIDKAEAPGRFDLPVAGHVVGLDTALETLVKEMREELGIAPSMLIDLQHLGCFECSHPSDVEEFRNVEYHEVYRAQLSADGWLGAHARDTEVAAVAAFQIGDLMAMVGRFPERVASGLKASLSRFTKSFAQRG